MKWDDKTVGNAKIGSGMYIEDDNEKFNPDGYDVFGLEFHTASYLYASNKTCFTNYYNNSDCSCDNAANVKFDLVREDGYKYLTN